MNDNVKLWNDEQHHARNVELVCQILESNGKNEAATTELYTLNRQHIYNFILKKLGNAGNGCDAEELTNDTFQRTFTHLHTIKEPEKILNWMFKVAGQLTAEWYRKKKRSYSSNPSLMFLNVTWKMHLSERTKKHKTEKWTRFGEKNFDKQLTNCQN